MKSKKYGNGIIINTDTIEFLKCLPDNFIDLVVTDPPYLIKYKSGFVDKDHDFSTEILNDDNPEFLRKYIWLIKQKVKNDGAVYFFASSTKIGMIKKMLESVLTVKNTIIWNKKTRTAGDLEGAFARQYEVLFLAVKGRPLIRGYRYSDVWTITNVHNSKRIHQNQKPVEIYERCITSFSDEGDLVFDGTAGSCPLAIAATKTNRDFICIEKDKKEYSKAIRRVDNFMRKHYSELSLFS